MCKARRSQFHTSGPQNILPLTAMSEKDYSLCFPQLFLPTSVLALALIARRFRFILCAQAAKDRPNMVNFAAEQQLRHIATYFPGRMSGSPAEMLTADYLQQQFAQMGYQSDIRQFHSRYVYTSRNKTKNWHNVTGELGDRRPRRQRAAKEQIMIVAHLDTCTPR